MTKITKTIDVEAVIASKNPRLLKVLPRFVINYIKKIFHQDEMNALIYENSDKYGLEFVHSVLDDFGTTIKVNGEENIPKEGKYIFASNHPLGGVESVAMMRMIGNHFPDLRFLVNDVLLNLKNYDPLFVPINKFGTQARESVKIIEEAYSSNNQILIFPAGLVSRKQKGVVKDLKWQKSFITKAVRHKRDVIPIFIHGQNSKFFYRLSSIRRFFGIKANIEMFYLADELYKKKNTPVEFNIGKPIPYSTFDKRFTPNEWAQKLKEHVYNLKDDYNTVFIP
jgi:putative hemolysin